MKMRILLIAAAVLVAAPARAQTAADSAAIRETVMNYVDGWYTGNADRMRSALHPELAKRIAQRDQSGAWTLDNMTAEELVAGTGRGGGTRTPEAQRQRDVVILDIFGNVASARATMSGWIDYMHLARIDGRWQIVNVLWELKPRS